MVKVVMITNIRQIVPRIYLWRIVVLAMAGLGIICGNGVHTAYAEPVAAKTYTCRNEKTVALYTNSSLADINAACQKIGSSYAIEYTCDDGKTMVYTLDTSANNVNKLCAAEGTTFKKATEVGQQNQSGSAATECAILPAEWCDSSGGDDNGEGSGIWKLLEFALTILTAGVGVAAVGGFVWAAFLYTTAKDSAEQTKRAKDMILQIVIGVLLYGLMFVLVNYLIPGGVLN